MNITDPIWRNCLAFPERTAFLFEGHPITYGQLQQTAYLVSSRLAKSGIKQGDVVALGLQSPAAYIAALLGAVRLGATVTSYVEAWPPDRKINLLRRNGVQLLVQAEEDTWRANGEGWAYLNAEELFRAESGAKVKVAPLADKVDRDPWLIALSSGTTGIPKSIAITHRRGNLDMALNYRGGDRVLVFSSLVITVGLTVVLRALVHGTTAVITMDLSPENFFKTAERDKPTRVFTTTGLVARILADAEERKIKAMDACQSISVIQVAGGIVPPGLRMAIKKHICNQIEVDYGATETAALALLTTDDANIRPSAHGRLYPWVQGQAVDDKGMALPPGREGLLRFRTPLVTDGYFKDEAATPKAFREGWYLPGDRGLVDAAGYLYLTGRADHVLNIGGVKINAERIEDVVNSHPSVLESAVVAVPKSPDEVPVLFAVIVPAGEFQTSIITEIKRLCGERLGRNYGGINILVAKSLPKNDGGKIMRGALAASIRFRRDDSASGAS